MIDLTEFTPLEKIQELPIWETGELVQAAESAGQSNMNLVLRVLTNQRSLIIKQSKAYVRKFPQIQAPIQRIEVEFSFLKLLGEVPSLGNYIPKINSYHPENFLLVMEDLGRGSDFSGIYEQKRILTIPEIEKLAFFLSELHRLEVDSFPSNLAMRKLNHEHIFNFPFLEENGFDLNSIQPGLQELSIPIKQDEFLKSKIRHIGERYLSTGDTLLHGDFYPGSWLDVPSGIKIIDPEFGFLGDPEFDLGVFLAHLDLGQQPEALKAKLLESYALPLDPILLDQYRGVEILRRLIGIAQIPTNMSLSQKVDLLAFAKKMILSI